MNARAAVRVILVRLFGPVCAIMILTLASIDMSPSLFQSLGATLDQGIVQVQWHFMKKGFKP